MLAARILAVSSGFIALSAAQEWRQLPSTAHPHVDARLAMAFDPVRQRTVCCACEIVASTPSFTTGRTTTWEWDGARWLQRVLATSLPPLADPIAMAWDGARQKVVLANSNGQLWSFDGIDWQLVLPGNTAFDEPSLAFDAARGVLVCADYGNLYEEQNGLWVLRASTTPLAYGGTRIAFDGASARVIAFGGWNPTAMSGETWSWDGTTLALLAPATSPAGRALHALTVDPVTGRPLLLGGADPVTQQRFGDAYEWDGSTWLAQPSLPQPRESHVAAPFGNEVLVFGGKLGASFWSWTHSHEAVRRTAGTFATVPMAAPGAVSAFDPVRVRTVSVGTSTYEFDGHAWSDTGITPPSNLIALAGHVAGSGIVGVDQAGATWLFDGIAWSAPALAQQPPARYHTALALDPVRNRVVLFGGDLGLTVMNDVWEWDGAAWTNPLPPTSPPAGRSLFAWDAPGQRLVLVPTPMLVGSSTWTWDGAAWSAVCPAVAGHYALGLAGHAAAGPVLLTASMQPYSSSQSAWLLAGNAWVPLPNGPDVRSAIGSFVFMFDPYRGEVVLHEGFHRRSLILSLQAADALAAGPGCAGSNGIPLLIAANLPQLGALVRSDLHRAAPSSFAFLLAGLAGANVPLPGGCTQLVANPIVLVAAPTNAAGFVSASWSVPTNPALRGIVLHEQALTLDSGGALLGFASLTAALQLRVGD